MRTSIEKLPIVTGIVRDFGFRLYFRAQRLSWRQRLRCVPMLFLAETFVYRADAVVERAKDVDLVWAAAVTTTPCADTGRRLPRTK